MLVELTESDGMAYEIIQTGLTISTVPNNDDLYTIVDAMIGCIYDGVKYYCKPIVVVNNGSFVIYGGNIKVMHDFMLLQGNTEDPELIQSSLSKADLTLDMFENLPFMFAVIDSSINLANIENGNITESFGSHTFEIISSVPPVSRGKIQESMVIDELPDMSEKVFVQGFNFKTYSKLLVADNTIPVLINGKPFNMYHTKVTQELPDGSEADSIYYATAVEVYGDTLHTVTHYFTNTNSSQNSTLDIVFGKLIYRGSRTTLYNLSSLKQQ